ncbi:MAG: glycerol-3-phosphate 1-O-acyltransferase PlsY [Nitrospirota bacterium]
MTDPLILNPALYLLVPVAYLIGSIPFGLLIGKRMGIDLRASGSKNIGATNVLRTAGKVPALLTLIGDSLKGAIPLLIFRKMFGNAASGAELWEGVIGLTAVIGHIFPVFLSFKGGKGVATGFGVIAVYSPVSAAVALLVWILIAALTRYSSLAAISAVLSLPLIYLLSGGSFIKIFFGILLAILIVLKHKQNIKKLINGTESRIGAKAA